MRKKTLVFGTVFIILSMAFYPLIEYLIKDFFRGWAYAKYSSYENSLYNISEEMAFVILLLLAGSVVAVVSFGFSGTYFVYKHSKKYKYVIK